MLRYGIISEVNYEKGRARVFFDELGIVSGWLTLPKNINENKFFATNVQVAVIMHENGEDGEILHTVPSDDQLPPSWASETVEGFQFKDGTKVTYDNASKELTVEGGINEIIFKCSKLRVEGTIEATGDVTAGTVSLQNHVHPVTYALVAGANPVTGTITVNKP